MDGQLNLVLIVETGAVNRVNFLSSQEDPTNVSCDYSLELDRRKREYRMDTGSTKIEGFQSRDLS
ncbi:MAG: hypothetical protein AUI50_00745 [Crenarchaeota archaeon 13_1_40CM_2_52_14]|nr:MAG: hypothetical protein AUI97_09650 [Crenarchaeota archaeon 13_1_40CM_3_52_17]OLD35759.1 MAG: hypothetical protein AUI50_00745 [Crenarchaeota archaeon 13_1_40CM_2_52_14]OLE69001.1 MAG: hypothetical protein AUF78_13360 [archaeon 13_1_20CM_2_51_12]